MNEFRPPELFDIAEGYGVIPLSQIWTRKASDKFVHCDLPALSLESDLAQTGKSNGCSFY